jgi:hypothetical protein
MSPRPLLRATLAVALLALASAAGAHAQTHGRHDPHSPYRAHGAAADAAAQPTLRGRVQVVGVRVGASGFKPARIALRAGVPARLVFTRTARSTCAVQVEVPAFGVPKTDLPLGRPVAVEFTPREAGEFAFACGMGMERGALLVRQ